MTDGVRVTLAIGLAVGSTFLWGLEEPERRRATTPTWDDVPSGVFFRDAFAEGLRGERPPTLGVPVPLAPISGGAVLPGAKTTPDTGWSQLITATSLEDELKTIKRKMDEALRSEGYFKGQGYRQLRPHLGTAAVVFAVIDQFDGQVRWQADAALARDRFARAAQNSKVGSTQVFREVQQRQRDLTDLIRGARLSGTGDSRPLVWPDAADRILIMQRLEQSVQETLARSVTSVADMRDQRDDLQRETELVAVLARVMTQEDMPDAGDAEYDEFCDQLQQAARELRQSIEQQDVESARRSHGKMKNSCADCHELYRA